MDRKRFWIIASVLLAVLGIIIAIVCVTQCFFGGDGETPLNEPEIPTVNPSTPEPYSAVPTPQPSLTPAPVFADRLPLVPNWNSDEPVETNTPPPSESPTANFVPTLGQYDDDIKDFLAVGTENGVATAVLLVRLEGTTLYIVAIPYEAEALVYTLNSDCQITEASRLSLGLAIDRGGNDKNQQSWNLIWSVKNLIGVQVSHYLSIDLKCLPDVLNELETLSGVNADYSSANIGQYLQLSGESRAYFILDLGVGLLKKLRNVSIWELPGIQSATKGQVRSSLGTRELIALARCFQGVETIECYALPLVSDGESWRLNEEESLKILQILYK